MSSFLLEQPELLTLVAVTAASALAYFLTRYPSRSGGGGGAAQPALSRDIGDGVRVSSLCTGTDLLDDPYDGVETLADAFLHGLEFTGDGPCLGHREGDTYIWMSYRELATRLRFFGSGLIAEGIPAGGEKKIGIIGINCKDWVVAQLGAVFYNIVFVPMYDTLGDDAVSHILQQTACEIVIAHPNKLAKMRTFLGAGPNKVKMIVKMCEAPTEEECTEFQDLNVRLCSFTEIEALGEASPKDHFLPKPEDVYTICYTSGTTGIPKGAIITHQNMTTTMAGVMKTNSDFILSPADVHFSYLPLCHLFEMSVHLFTYTAGASIGFYSGSPLVIAEDIRILRPTVFPAVPRVLNKFMEKIKKTIAAKGAVASWLFEKALASKSADLERGVMRLTIWDRLLLGKIRESFGGRINLIATGAAPILPETLNFFRAVFNSNVYEGFGQTESTAGCTFTQPGDFVGGHVGPPLPSNYIKLVDSEETGHFVRDGQGEVCVKGKNVFKGYYLNPETTAEALDPEGWLHTGDIGIWNPQGCLRIVDRKKYIFKTSIGEYIAPEKIENVFELHELVQQMFIDGDSSKPKIAAVVIPDPDNFQKWVARFEKGGMDGEALLEDPEINSAFLTEINAFAKSKLKPFELIAKMRLTDTAMSIENDFLTPTFKKKRPGLKRHFSKSFEIMYSEIH